jgi:hypothetical protein
MTIEKVEYKGWQNCLRIANDPLEMSVTSDVGPRIIRLAIPGGENEFYVSESLAGKTGGDRWVNYGGHRLWHAPEDKTRTYAPDNSSIVVEDLNGKMRFSQPLATLTGIQKEIDIVLDPKAARATIIHRLWNKNLWTIDLAPWAISVMDRGGVGILPLPPRRTHDDDLLPSNTIAIWGYTDMSDARYTWGRKYILMRQDASQKNDQKIGLFSSEGWIGYAHDGRLFIKIIDSPADATYPDMGCNIEAYTNDHMLEVETLGPMVSLAPGQKVEHREEWLLFKNVPMPKNDEDVERHIVPLVSSALRKP